MWECLENVPELIAVPAVWEGWLGGNFPAFRQAFLSKLPQPAKSYPCARGCGCEHEIVKRRDGSLVAVCRCDPWCCEDFAVTLAQSVLLGLNWPRLGRAIITALKCDGRDADVGVRNVRQIGAFSASAVPVILCVQQSPDGLATALAAMAVKLGKPFALLVPSSRFIDAGCLSVLKATGAEWFDLESNCLFLADGRLQARKGAGELFGGLLAGASEPQDEDVARRLFALVEELEAEGNYRKAPVVRVFQLYCVKRLSRSEVAKRCSCVPSLITLRLKAIERKLGRNPSELRVLSSHFEKIGESLSDSRARRVDRERAIYGHDPDGDEGNW